MTPTDDDIPIEQLALRTHYVSTYCMHGKHTECRLTCKHCDQPCRCSCGHPGTTEQLQPAT